MKVSGSFVMALVMAALSFLYINHTVDLDREGVKGLLRNGKQAFPLKGRTAVVTGSTSGLGLAIATELYGFGATVYVVGRSPGKLARVAAEITSTCSATPGSVLTEVLDTADLVSVKAFAGDLQASLGDTNIDYLVNNAGIHYVSTVDAATHASPQGYDVAFATNYLGHFLLTELLLPSMADDGRVVQVASTMHMMSDASMLFPAPTATTTTTATDTDTDTPAGTAAAPLAAQHLEMGDARRDWQITSQYGNNKLAQILHSKELQRRLSRKGSGIKVISVCPNWVNTNILPDDVGGRFVASQAFSPSAGALSALHGLFSSSMKGGDYVSNSRVVLLEIPGFVPGLLALSKAVHVKARMVSINVLSMVVLGLQKFFYGATVTDPSPEANDKALQRALYLWSKAAVKDFLE